ncbi:MAG: ATP-binding protein [Dolichospermum sp. LBC05a]|nr:ATP-binding protein [Dolichospermum sp. OL01]MCO5798823.1 ATP-binding protein [Dolichospermum sp. OL03]MCS6282010.1 ATP-binding protein [Dolichospermum sp.]QSV60228.1 MAG: ATP-binding protein [Dolichospermum sp. LBC05a]
MLQTIAFPGHNTNSMIQTLREDEFNCAINALEKDKDLLITGVPGSGRHSLIQEAALKANVKVLKIDCIKAINQEIFIKQLCQNIMHTFKNELSLNMIEQWYTDPVKKIFEFKLDDKKRLQIELSPTQNKLSEKEKNTSLFEAFKVVIDIPQKLAEVLKQRIVLILENFSHIRSWDRKDHKWEIYLKNTINKQELVSYVIIATTSEINTKIKEERNNQKELIHINISPIKKNSLITWLDKKGLSFNKEGLDLFLNTVEGHLGDANTLVRRLQAVYTFDQEIGKEQIQKTVNELLEDMSVIFESLLLLLPPTQVQLLECLALNPDKSPYSRELTNKYSLLRGGSLRNAIFGLQEKGLLYSSEEKYRVTLPLLSQWIKKRIQQDN